MTETQRRIRAYKKALPELRERVIAVAVLLAMSASMLASASFAWITLSTAPEVSGMATTVATNGNLEIALAKGSIAEPAKAPDESQVGDAASKLGIVDSNTTWGNLVNLSDISYGLGAIELRPALMNAHSRNETPLKGASYGVDGRVVDADLDLGYTSYGELEEGAGVYMFYAGADKVNYGVRAISSIGYGAPSGDDANDPMKQLAESYLKTARSHYTDAQDHYAALVSDNTAGKPAALELKPGSGKYCVNTLEALVNIVAADELSGSESDCKEYVPYLMRMTEELMVVLDHEGEALLTMANWQAYASGKSQSTKTFADADALRKATNAELSNLGITLSTLAEHKSNRTKLESAITGLTPYVEKAENGEKVVFSEIAGHLGSLVDIYTTEIGGIPFNKISSDIMGNAGTIMSAKTVEVKKGVLKDIELRVIPNDLTYRMYAKVTVKASFITLNPYVYTAAMNQEPTYVADYNYTRGLVAQDKGEGRALNTYGMALDMWLRTNHPNAVLTLEGTVVYREEPATTTIEGKSYELYTITVEDEQKEIFQKDDVWYYAESLNEVGEAELAGATPSPKIIQVPIGYQGENRIWEDWENMLEEGLIAKDSTTQGAGSCFVFYADPADQVKIMEMLRAFTVKFVDKDYKDLGEAKLNIEKATENQGKVTVPLEMQLGAKYEDNGIEKTGIMQLPQNEPTLVTAIVYLNGSQLMNENVLAAHELNGQLNIQFGTNAVLVAPNDQNLQQQYRTITATVTVGDTTISNGTIAGSDNEGLPYREGGYEATVTLTVDGDQPQSITGAFIRTLNNGQGTRGEDVTFTTNADGTWSAKFTLVNPGNYIFNSLTVDGIQYSLHDGTDGEHEANQPGVFIRGLSLGTVTAKIDGVPASGLYMTSNRSVPVVVEAEIKTEMSINSVSAKFTNKDKTKQYSAILTYNKNTGLWTGTANINSSDIYYLQLLTVDGTTIDVPVQNEFTLKVGLTARVKTTVPEDERDWPYEGQSVQLPMQVELINDNGTLQGELIKNLEHVYLKYEGIDNAARMTWNPTTLRYEGVLAPLSPGVFSYDAITLGENAEMGRLYLDSIVGDAPPVFSCMSQNAPTYTGEMTDDKQTVIQTGTDAVFHIQTADAQAAYVWADVLTPSGETVNLEGVRKQGFQDQRIFTLRNNDGEKEDGIWTLQKLYFQNVYDPVAEYKYVYGGTEFYTIDVADQNITTEVIATPVVEVLLDGVQQSLGEVNTITLGGENEPFMSPNVKTGVLSVQITDYEGNAIDGLKNVYWLISHDRNTMYAYGSYTGDKGYGTNPLKLTKNTDGTIWTAEAQNLPFAGVYTSTVKTFYDWHDEDQKEGSGQKEWQTIFEVTTGKPNVTISAVSPSTNENFSTTKYVNGTPTQVQNVKNYISADKDHAVVYLKGSQTLGFWNYTMPKVTLKLEGVAKGTASLTMINAADNSKHHVFNFTANASAEPVTSQQTAIGGSEDATLSHETKYLAGKTTFTSIPIVCDGITYLADLRKPVIIEQPEAPAVLSFAGLSEDIPLENRPSSVTADGATVTVTLPEIEWLEKTTSAPQYSAWSDWSKIRVVRTDSTANNQVFRTRYRYYEWTEYSRTRTSTGTTTGQNKQILSWMINGKSYNAGTYTLELTTDTVAMAVVTNVGDPIDMGNQVTTHTEYRYQYVNAGDNKSSLKGQLINTGNFSYPTVNTDTYYSNIDDYSKAW